MPDDLKEVLDKVEDAATDIDNDTDPEDVDEEVEEEEPEHLYGFRILVKRDGRGVHVQGIQENVARAPTDDDVLSTIMFLGATLQGEIISTKAAQKAAQIILSNLSPKVVRNRQLIQ